MAPVRKLAQGAVRYQRAMGWESITGRVKARSERRLFILGVALTVACTAAAAIAIWLWPAGPHAPGAVGRPPTTAGSAKVSR